MKIRILYHFNLKGFFTELTTKKGSTWIPISKNYVSKTIMELGLKKETYSYWLPIDYQVYDNTQAIKIRFYS